MLRKLKTLPLLIFYFICIASIQSQNKQQRIDSISILLKKAFNDSLIVLHNIELGILTDTSTPLKAKQHFEKALNMLSNNYIYSNKYQMIALANDCLGIIERRRNNYDKALDYYLEALRIKEKVKDSAKIGRSYHNIAMLFSAQKNYSKAISYIKIALPLRKHDSVDYGVSLNNYGYFLYKEKKYSKALKVLDSAKSYLKNDAIRFCDANNNISRIYRAKKEYKKALTLQSHNLEVYQKFEKLERMTNTMKDIAIIYRKMKKFKKALSYLDSSETLGKKYGNKKLIATTYLQRYKISKTQQDYKLALTNYRTYKKYKDSVYTIEKAKQITALELNFKHDKKITLEQLNHKAEKHQLEEIAKTERFQKRFYGSLLILTILGLISFYFIYNYRRKIHNGNIKKQELEANLLNERVIFLQYKIDRLLADDKMRSDFKEKLIEKVKHLKSHVNSKNLIDKYQSILIQLENQTKTENRLDHTMSKETKKDDNGFELKLAEQFPQLTKSEREICHLINLNLNLKEIMNIRNVTLSSVKSARYRIRKKLEIPKSIELELFIQSLF